MAGPDPLANILAGLIENPFAELADQLGFFCQRQKVPGIEQSALGVLPPYQASRPTTRLVVEHTWGW